MVQFILAFESITIILVNETKYKSLFEIQWGIFMLSYLFVFLKTISLNGNFLWSFLKFTLHYIIAQSVLISLKKFYT